MLGFCGVLRPPLLAVRGLASDVYSSAAHAWVKDVSKLLSSCLFRHVQGERGGVRTSQDRGILRMERRSLIDAVPRLMASSISRWSK